ncbi:MAG: hypothetical protein NC830_04285 [Candidatus Omnitrophica bacterium]|nr:hypothetical protein [Candidatus Omnitrophota bacterium]
MNEKIRTLAKSGFEGIYIKNICGQRYISAGFTFKGQKLMLKGIPGNDLGVFLDGPEILVYNNVQDGTVNTMNSGRIVVYGDAGDITGHSMRGSEIFIRGNTGYRAGIHMKEYKQMSPVIVIGGRAGNFLGEYMGGGLIIALGLIGSCPINNYTATGMHGGTIYVRGRVPDVILGREIKVFLVEKDEYQRIMPNLEMFAGYFAQDIEKICKSEFQKIVPATHRPYGKIYSY